MDADGPVGLRVRAAVPADLDALVALQLGAVRQLTADPPAGFGGNPAATPDARQLHGEFTTAIAAADQVLLVAELDGRVAGSALGTVEEYGDELLEAPYLTVQYVATEPAARGRGVARALLAALEGAARERGLSVLELRVWSNNRAAIELYISQGFEAVEQRMARRLR